VPRDIVVCYGGTVEPIDDVRVLTNLSRGALGRVLCRAALVAGARVHALVGRFAQRPAPHERLTVEEFGSTLDLAGRLEGALRAPARPPGLAMAAAVSDYRPRRLVRGKISSAAARLTIELVKNPKLVDKVRAWRPGTRVVSWKLGADGASDEELIALARGQLARTRSLAVIANRYPRAGRHDALWIDAASLGEGAAPRLLRGRAAIARGVIAALLAPA